LFRQEEENPDGYELRVRPDATGKEIADALAQARVLIVEAEEPAKGAVAGTEAVGSPEAPEAEASSAHRVPKGLTEKA